MSNFRESQATDPGTQYATTLFAQEDQALLRAKSAALELGVERLMVSPLEGKILYTLLKIHGSKKVVEIGGLTGYSALWMARAVGDSGFVYSFELEAARASLAQQIFEDASVATRTKVIVGDATANLCTIEKDGPFDAIFIDANKGAYPDYLSWAENHLRVGGLIIGDNTFLWGQVWKDHPDEGTTWATLKSMQEFNKRLADSVRFDSILLPTREGMTVAIKKF